MLLEVDNMATSNSQSYEIQAEPFSLEIFQQQNIWVLMKANVLIEIL